MALVVEKKNTYNTRVPFLKVRETIKFDLKTAQGE